MMGDNARRALLETYGRGVLQTRVLINIDEEPLKPYDMPLTNPSLRYTRMNHCIRYVPQIRLVYKKTKKRYVIFSDIIDKECGTFRFDSWEELEEESKRNKEIAFLIKYTNLNENMLKIVDGNLFFDFPLLFDYEKYDKVLRDKVEAEIGIRPEYSMFIDPALLEVTNEPFRDWMAKYNKEL